MTTSLAQPQDRSRWQIWFQAVRFFSFTASVVPILVGSALALVDGQFSIWLVGLMLVASVACHAGANLANDYYDYKRGIDTEESLGPSKVIQQELLTPDEVKQGMFVAFTIATILGLVVVFDSGWEILALALASLAVAYLYTGGPKPLAYVGLGEIAVFIFMGPVMVCGAYYVLAGEITWEAFLLSLPVGCLVAAILHANNIRDIDLDRAAGKVTIATRVGRTGANIEYVLLVGGAYIALIAATVATPSNWPILAAGATLPLAWSLSREILAGAGPMALNLVLRKTAGLHLRVGLLVTAGLMVRWLLDSVL